MTTNDEYYLPDDKAKQVAIAFNHWLVNLDKSRTDLLEYTDEELYELWLKEQAE